MDADPPLTLVRRADLQIAAGTLDGLVIARSAIDDEQRETLSTIASWLWSLADLDQRRVVLVLDGESEPL